MHELESRYHSELKKSFQNLNQLKYTVKTSFKMSRSLTPGFEEEYIQRWLNNHQDFAENFVEKWLLDHPKFIKTLYSKYGHLLGMQALIPQKAKSSPERIKGKKTLRQYISTPNIPTHNWKRKPASELRKLNRQKLFVELLTDVVSPDVDINHLSHKILVNVLLLTTADRSSLFLVEGPEDNQILVSRLFDVTESISVEDAIHDETEAIKMPMGVGIAGTVAKTGEAINLQDAYEDPRFNRGIDAVTGYQTKSILCMPIKTADGQVIGVAQVINKTNGETFTTEDEDVFRTYLNFCAIGLVNAQLFNQSFALSRNLQILLHLARGLFEDTTQLEVMMNKVMRASMRLIPCECCSVLLLDNESKEKVVFSQAFQVDQPQLLSEDIDIRSVEIDKISDMNIAEYVATRAAPAITSSVGQKSCDQSPTLQRLTLSDDTKNILCIPIFNNNDQVLGVVKLTNKLNQACFSQTDVESLEVFATFCGLGIHNVMMYEKISITSARNKVAFDLLSYHSSSSIEEANRLMQLQVPEASIINLTSFKFDDCPLIEDETALAAVRIFADSGILEPFKIDIKVLHRWILTVKKNYRPVTYHNWRHAFNVAQTMFAMFKEGSMTGKFSKLEELALLIACFCHDLDHRGTNNAFQVKSGNVLAKLYSTSTMEHHHFDRCIMILNSEGNQLLDSLSPTKYTQVLNIVESAILSTDLALYFKKKGYFQDLVENNQFNWEQEDNRDLFRGMIMTACDVAAITKPWKIQKRVANMVASEFFEQGDLERNNLLVEPIAMMDRKKKDELPKMQVGFIDSICMPLYKVLATLVPDLVPLLEGVKNNRNNWQALADNPKAYVIESESSELSSERISQGNTDGKISPTPSVESPPATIVTPAVTLTTPTHLNSDTCSNSNTFNGPIEGWRNSSAMDEENPASVEVDCAGVKEGSNFSTHAEVLGKRRQLNCSLT